MFAVDHFTAGQLAEHLGVTLALHERADLQVRFANGDSERWVPAPDGYPLDGSLSFIHFRGRYYVPADEACR